MAPRILIVEDNASFAGAIETLLRGKGWLTEIAGDGVTALQRILAEPPELLLLDLQLPGLHGVELLRKLRAVPRTAQLPVIVMSGVYKGERYVQATRALGVETYLEKPFGAPRLLEALQSLLGSSAPAAAKAPVVAPSPAPVAASTPIVAPPPAPTPPAPTGFDRLLVRVFQTRFSGQLLLRSAATTHSLILVNGVPVALRPGFKHLDFGDYLQKNGVLSAEEYAYYAQAGEYRHDLLVQMGCLGYGELLERKFAYLSGELAEAFTRPPLVVEERPMAVPPGLQVMSINMPQVICNGYRALLTPERSKRYLEQFAPRFAALTPSYYEWINFLSLGEAERHLLPRLDGTRTVRDCVADDVELAPFFCAMHALGMLRLDAVPLPAAPQPPYPLRVLFNSVEEVELYIPEETLESFADLADASRSTAPPGAPPLVAATAPAAETPLGEKVRATYAQLQGKNYYEALGLTQGNFSFEKLKQGYFALTREFSPDVLMQLGGEEAAQAEEILSTVTNAYNTLSDVVKKDNYDQLLGADRIGLGQEGDDKFQAQVQAQSAKVFIEMEEWDNAEKSLNDACAIEPQNGDYLAHLAWAIYRNPKHANSRATLDKAKQMLNRAVALERTAPGFAFKGWLLIEAGQEMLAESEFNKALKLDARNTLARKGLRQILEKREQQKKGLFGRMFNG